MHFRHLPFTTAIALVAALPLTPALAQITVYSNDFSSNANGFSPTTLTTAPAASGPHLNDQFLGQLGNQTATLSLTGLAAHSLVTLNFDLYIIQSLDGNGPFGGAADPWSLDVDGTTTLLDTNFANFAGNTQGFGGPDGGGGYIQMGSFAPQTGAQETNTLGYTFGGPMDSVYHFTFTFPDSATSLTFHFVGGQNQPIIDESWGLDNVSVTTNAAPSTAAPEPGAAALLISGLMAGVGSFRRRQQRHK